MGNLTFFTRVLSQDNIREFKKKKDGNGKANENVAKQTV